MTPEMIAKKFMGMLSVYAPCKADQIDEMHWAEAENWLIEEIKNVIQEQRIELLRRLGK